jgi:hypothetical protein
MKSLAKPARRKTGGASELPSSPCREADNALSLKPLSTLSSLRGTATMTLFGLLLMFLFARAGWADRIVRIGIYENSPKVGLSASGQPEGIFVDLIEAIAEREGWSLKYVFGTWPEGLDRLAAGEIDLMPDVAYTTQREDIFAFHKEPVLSDWFQIYARRGDNIRSLLDLNGKRVAVLERSVQQAAFEQLLTGFDLHVKVVSFPDYADTFRAVRQKRADAVISNRFYGSRHAREYGIADTAIIFNPARLFFAAPKTGNPALLDAVDRNLVQFKKDPDSIYYRSLRHWTSEKMDLGVSMWIKSAGMVAAALLLVAVLWNVTLKRQVATRTRELGLRGEQIQTMYEQEKLAEQGIRELNAGLEQRVAERTAELALERDRAEAADRTKSAFLASMSHELRTPLNSILGFTGLLLQGLAGPLNAEQSKQLGMVKNSGRHLLDLINDVLDISKIEAGQIEIASAEFDLPESLRNVLQTVTPLAGKKHLPLTARISPEVGRIMSDRRRVEQILLNLLSNAIKFTERGEITLTAETVPGTTRIPRSALRVSVADTGPGIKPEDLGRLFQPFRQLDTGLTRRHEGTGLGLAICKRLIERLGGTISVRSECGRGSTFSFTLPIHPEGNV